ncbi:MAG: hypothetical protein LBD23_12840 [Oscillospiraceae bacterium]|jgi:hypothetical protein|nr:hypothetical protein [Oscillospiraceae bacterium]
MEFRLRSSRVVKGRVEILSSGKILPDLDIPDGLCNIIDVVFDETQFTIGHLSNIICSKVSQSKFRGGGV